MNGLIKLTSSWIFLGAIFFVFFFYQRRATTRQMAKQTLWRRGNDLQKKRTVFRLSDRCWKQKRQRKNKEKSPASSKRI